MAKKKIKKTIKNTDVKEQLSNVLPQNIVLIGERVEEDKNIYISQKVYKEIHKFTQDKTTNESGGMLIGTVIEEFGKHNIIINEFIEAKYSEGTPTTLKFTHETWEYVHKEITKKYANQRIVGWIHTHPDFGIFLSEYDKFIQENFFKDETQIAYVVDPIQNIEGFYFWMNGKIERCKGFYIFDKNGVKISVMSDIDESTDNDKSKTKSGYLNIMLGVFLSAAVVILLIMNFALNNRLNVIEQQQKTLTDSANSSLSYMQQQIVSMSQELKALKELKSSIEDNSSSDNANTSEQINKNEQSQPDKKQNTDEKTDASQQNNNDGASETTSSKEVKPNE